jgi:high-affinity Fe2+/Pb2+ permease
MDHSHDHASVDGPWAGGWLVAAVAGLIAATLARMLGDVGISPAVLVGAVVFGVYGVLLGNGGVELVAADDHGDGQSHGGHH